MEIEKNKQIYLFPMQKFIIRFWLLSCILVQSSLDDNSTPNRVHCGQSTYSSFNFFSDGARFILKSPFEWSSFQLIYQDEQVFALFSLF